MWGEPLEVTLKAENLGPGDFNFMFGSDNHVKVEVTDAAGKLLPDPYANSRDMDGVMGFEVLDARRPGLYPHLGPVAVPHDRQTGRLRGRVQRFPRRAQHGQKGYRPSRS